MSSSGSTSCAFMQLMVFTTFRNMTWVITQDKPGQNPSIIPFVREVVLHTSQLIADQSAATSIALKIIFTLPPSSKDSVPVTVIILYITLSVIARERMNGIVLSQLHFTESMNSLIFFISRSISSFLLSSLRSAAGWYTAVMANAPFFTIAPCSRVIL